MKTNFQSRDYQEFLEDLSGYYQEENQAEEKLYIGDRLRGIREMQGLSLDKLARLSGIEEARLAEIEDKKALPDLHAIIRLSKALRIGAGLLLDEASGFHYSVTRRTDRAQQADERPESSVKRAYLYQSLSTGVKSRHMEAFVITLENSFWPPDTSFHDGEEFLIVQEGEIEIRLGAKVESLRAGDSIYYLSSIPHALRSVASRPSVILAVVYTG
jgi:transcriptional regulator with XRE-family HTH domain